MYFHISTDLSEFEYRNAIRRINSITPSSSTGTASSSSLLFLFLFSSLLFSYLLSLSPLPVSSIIFFSFDSLFSLLLPAGTVISVGALLLLLIVGVSAALGALLRVVLPLYIGGAIFLVMVVVLAIILKVHQKKEEETVPNSVSSNSSYVGSICFATKTI
jgi:hypothetical protein